MRMKIGQDLATGLLFMAIGIGALVIGWNYPMGIPQRPGTGVLPFVLSCCLIGTGALLAVKSFTVGDSEITGINWRALILVTLGLVVFGFAIDRLGLLITMALSMSLCAAALRDTEWREFAIFFAIMFLASWVTFVCLLGMPVNACPSVAPCELCWLVKTPIRLAYEFFTKAVQ
ncbi:MAG: tripartite tricarboxylate transporter TctB family protein [Hyphomicrobiaceae bacterium]